MVRRIFPNKSAKLPRRNKLSPWDRALRYISFRPRSEKEVRDYLGDDASEELIFRLKELKFLDDSEYAKWHIEQRTRFRPKSRKLLELELKRKGIALEEDIETNSDEALATAALSKKDRLWSGLTFQEYKVKAGRFLASRGFSWEVVEKVVKKRYNYGNVR